MGRNDNIVFKVSERGHVSVVGEFRSQWPTLALSFTEIITDSGNALWVRDENCDGEDSIKHNMFDDSELILYYDDESQTTGSLHFNASATELFRAVNPEMMMARIYGDAYYEYMGRAQLVEVLDFLSQFDVTVDVRDDTGLPDVDDEAYRRGGV